MWSGLKIMFVKVVPPEKWVGLAWASVFVSVYFAFSSKVD